MIVVQAPAGVARFAGTEQERNEVLRLISYLDGSITLREICRTKSVSAEIAQDVAAAIDEVGGLADSNYAWLWFARAAANPPIFKPPMTVTEAYMLPRWRPSVQPTAYQSLPGWPASPPWRRGRSVDLSRASAHDLAALKRGVVIVAAELMRIDGQGHLPFSAAGAIWPLQVWIVTPLDAEQRSVELLDHFSGRLSTYKIQTVTAVMKCFLDDPDLHCAIARGCGIVVLAADPSRITAKYGDRGWNYTLMECGQAIHRLEYLSSLMGLVTRPIGGFIEDELQSLLGEPGLIPLCTVLIADDPS